MRVHGRAIMGEACTGLDCNDRNGPEWPGLDLTGLGLGREDWLGWTGLQ